MTDPRQHKELVDRCLAWESGAWEELASHSAPYLLQVIRQALGKTGARTDLADEEEVLQEVFLSLVRDDAAVLRRFQWDCPFLPYLASLASRICVDRIRRERGRGREARPAPLPWDEVSALADDVAGGATRRGDTGEAVRRGLERLPERERLIVRLHYWGELPAEAIAKLLRLNPDSVRVFLSRARDQLRRFLSESLGMLIMLM